MDDLTVKKVADIMARSAFQQTGVVLRDPTTGEMCIVEQGAVRWVTGDDAWKLMHPDGLEGWIDANVRRPSHGQLIVAYFAREKTYWAGRYWTVKQSFDKWMPLEEAK